VCHEIVYINPGYPYDPNKLDLQQKLLAITAPPPSFGIINPTCNGLGTQTWVNRDVGANAITSYCEQEGVIAGDPNWEKRTTFNPDNKDNKIEVGISFQSSFGMTPQECKALLFKVLDGCDGNNPYDNPGNWKHGGSIKHPKGATLTLTPKGGAQPFCNSYGNPPGTAHWVTIDDGVKAVQEFCNFYHPAGKAGERRQKNINTSSGGFISFSMLFTKAFELLPKDCINA
jgi:hypothetical protein